MFKLYSYFRSSASYRVRIALHLKNISFETIPLDLRVKAHREASYFATNPQGLVPFFSDDTVGLAQSMAILEFLEKKYPTPALLPCDEKLHWKARELAQYIACEVHPINNLRVLTYLKETLEVSDDAKQAWYAHWIHEGFKVLEKELSHYGSPYALGDEPSWVDLCLIPQMYNARRFKIYLMDYPRLCAIEEHCLRHDAFQKALPEHQLDCDM